MKAVITAAGKETRMRPVSAIIPKALLPLFQKYEDKVVMLPVLELILRALSSAGANDVCVVYSENSKLIKSFLSGRRISYAKQDKPKGFGDAVTRAQRFVGSDPFVLHAGDGVLDGGYKEAIALFKEQNMDCVLLLRHTGNPKRYGIATVEDSGTFMGHKTFRVTGVEEKPQEPKSNYMISAVYIFKPSIFNAIKRAKQGESIELTPGIQYLIERGYKVSAMFLEREHWLNVGDTNSYFKALKFSYENL